MLLRIIKTSSTLSDEFKKVDRLSLLSYLFFMLDFSSSYRSPKNSYACLINSTLKRGSNSLIAVKNIPIVKHITLDK